MTPSRIGASCARTSLPPRPAAATVAAPQLFRGVFEEPLAESTRPSDRPAPERGPTRPEPIAHAGEKVRLRPSGKPFFGLLIGSNITQPMGQKRIKPSSPGDEL